MPIAAALSLIKKVYEIAEEQESGIDEKEE